MRFLLVLLAMLAVSPMAIAGEALVNSEVEVDATGKDAADARDQAMARASVLALTDLLNKLAAPGQADAIIAALDAKKVAAITRGTEVLDEKIGDNRYRAHLRVSFDAGEVSNLITQFGVGTASEELPTKTTSFLFLTSYEEEGSTLLWEERNPWRNVWKQIGLEVSSGDIIVPYGDNNDQGVVSEKTLASATYAALAPLAIRYGTSDIVILQAKYVKNPDMELTVVKRRINRTLSEVNVLNYRADPQETRDTLMARAARDIADNLQNKKSEEAVNLQGIRAGEKGKIMLLASITTLNSWTDLKARLDTLPMIEKLEILAMSPQQVDLVVHYRGSLEALAGGITGVGLRLSKNKDYWVTSRD